MRFSLGAAAPPDLPVRHADGVAKPGNEAENRLKTVRTIGGQCEGNFRSSVSRGWIQPRSSARAGIPPLVPQLICNDLLQLKPSRQAYLEGFQPLFPRRDQGMSFLAYAEGLLSGERPVPAGWRHEPGTPPAVLCGGQPLV